MAESVKKKEKFIAVKDAWRISTENTGIDVSLNQFKNWVKNNEHGIIGGKYGNRIVVREDTIPTVILF